MRQPWHPDVGQKHAGILAGRRDECPHELPTLWLANVDSDRSLALVQSGPVEAPPLRHDRQPRVVNAAPDHVDADDVRAELRQGHAGQRRGDEGRALHHTQATQKIHVHRCPLVLKSTRPGLQARERDRRDATALCNASLASTRL